MLKMMETRILRSVHEEVLDGVQIADEGVPLEYVKQDGKTKVDVASGAGLFAGVSQSRDAPPMVVPAVTEFVIPANGVIELERAPIAGQISIKIGQATFSLVAGVPAAGEFAVAGKVVTFNVADAGKVGKSLFRYVPSVIEANAWVGQAPIGGVPSAVLGIVGTIKEGTIATSEFDAASNWDDTLFVKVANGLFTAGDAANHITNVIVKSAPTAGSPWLVLSLNVA